MVKRRTFIKLGSSALLASWLTPSLLSTKYKDSHRFQLSLNPGAIGVDLNYTQLLEAAVEYGFQAIVPPLNEVVQWDNRKTVLELDRLQQNGISWGAVGLPVEFRKDRGTFEKGLVYLVENVLRLESANITRVSTWIMPTHEELSYEDNMNLHRRRLQQIADILIDHNIQLGLEYVGPKTLRESQKYPFVSNMKEAKELISNINRSNVGLQLDAFHWYCAGESKKDLLSLKASDIVTVDLNDAVAGRTREEQLDWERELPVATGVIDLKSFLEGLVEIGYDGPVRAEPFNKKLNELDNQTALQMTIDAMQKAVQLLDD